MLSTVRMSYLDDDALLDDMDFIDLDNLDDEPIILEQNLKKNKFITICNNCDSKDDILYEHKDGIIICNNCGFVINKIIDYNPEWNNFEGDKDVARCSTITDHFCPTASMSMPLTGIKNNKLKMLHTWNIMPYRERALLKVIKEISYRCEKGGILKCIEDDAKILFKYISESKHIFGSRIGKKKITRGGNHRSIIAACVFKASRRGKKPITRSEIAKIFGLTKKLITKGCKNFEKIIKDCKIKFVNEPVLPEYYIGRFCRMVGNFDMELVQLATQVTRNVRRLNIASSHTPIAIASTAILFIGEKYGIEDIRKNVIEKLEVSNATLTKTYKKIIKKENIIMDDVVVEKYMAIMENNRKTKMIHSGLLIKVIQNEIRYRETIKDIKMDWDNYGIMDFPDIFKRDNMILNL